MHNLEEIRTEYDRLDRLCGVDTRHISLSVSQRASKRLGCFTGGKTPKISISAFVMAEDSLFWDTIRHEYAHAVVYLRFPRERHGHDAVWKSVCRKVGCTPKATTVLPGELRELKAKYRLYCTHCGVESFYQRRGKIIELIESGRGKSVRCRRCGNSSFQIEYLK